MAGVGLTRIRHAHHVDVGHVVVGLDVALQFADQGAMRLGWVGERFRAVCLRHVENYADRVQATRRRARKATQPSTSPVPISPTAVSHENQVTLIRGPDVKLS